jgi:hypothetical protein
MRATRRKRALCALAYLLWQLLRKGGGMPVSRIIWFLCVVVCVSAIVAGPALARERARPGSYVRYSVQSVDDLVDQIINDPVVAKHYTSHYGMSATELADYFRDNLKLTTVQAPVKATTYFLSKDGRAQFKQRTLKAGKLVFVGPGGEMLLEADCGNPLTKHLPPAIKKKVMGSTETIELPSVEQVLAPPVMAAPPAAPEVVEQTATRVPESVAPIAAKAFAPSILNVAEAVVPALAGLSYMQNSKSSPAVPEPSSLVAMSVACLGMLSMARKRIRR